MLARVSLLALTFLVGCAQGTVEGYPSGPGIGPVGPGGDAGDGGDIDGGSDSGTDSGTGDGSGDTVGDDSGADDNGGTGDSEDGDPTDSGDDGDSSDGTDEGSSSDDGGSTPDYDAFIQPIWDAQCVRCHGPTAPEAGLDMSSGPEAIVGILSSQLPSMAFVQPGSLVQSYLWHKLVGDQASVGGSGVQMPEGSPPLSATDMAVIQSWIEGGAPE